jgi:hypothetical protein
LKGDDDDDGGGGGGNYYIKLSLLQANVLKLQFSGASLT